MEEQPKKRENEKKVWPRRLQRENNTDTFTSPITEAERKNLFGCFLLFSVR